MYLIEYINPEKFSAVKNNYISVAQFPTIIFSYTRYLKDMQEGFDVNEKSLVGLDPWEF